MHEARGRGVRREARRDHRLRLWRFTAVCGGPYPSWYQDYWGTSMQRPGSIHAEEMDRRASHHPLGGAPHDEGPESTSRTRPFPWHGEGVARVLHLVGNDAALIAARPNGPPARWEGVSAELPAGRPRQLVHQHHFSRGFVSGDRLARVIPELVQRRRVVDRARDDEGDHLLTPLPGDARPHRPRRPSGGSRGRVRPQPATPSPRPCGSLRRACPRRAGGRLRRSHRRRRSATTRVERRAGGRGVVPIAPHQGRPPTSIRPPSPIRTSVPANGTPS